MYNASTSNLSKQQENEEGDCLENSIQRAQEVERYIIQNKNSNNEKKHSKMLSNEENEAIEDIKTKIVDELNQKLAIVHTNTTHILIEKNNTFVLDSKTSVITLYENDTVEIGEKKISRVQIWLKSPSRRTFHDIVFNPKISGHYEDNYNIWKGFAIKPIQGNSSLFWTHIRDIICSGKEIHYLYVRKWLAHLIQKPWIISTALVLRGKQGTGKGTFVNAIGELLGSHFAPLASLNHIVGRFNSHLKNAILIFADEAIWCGDKKDIGILKSLITEPKMFIEAKGKDGYWIDNYKHLIVSSNEDRAVPIDPDDRRFFVLDVSSDRKEDSPYFNALQAQLNNGGLQALMYDLMNEDLSGFDPKIMPENFTGFDMKLATAPNIDQFLYEALRDGHWDHTLLDQIDALRELTINDFYSHYKAWCGKENEIPLRKELVGRRLRKVIPGITKKRTSREIDSARPVAYVFPTLEECRRSFEIFYKQNSAIWDWS